MCDLDFHFDLNGSRVLYSQGKCPVNLATDDRVRLALEKPKPSPRAVRFKRSHHHRLHHRLIIRRYLRMHVLWQSDHVCTAEEQRVLGAQTRSI